MNVISRISITLIVIGVIVVLALFIVKPTNQSIVYHEPVAYSWHRLSIVSIDKMSIWATYAEPKDTRGVAILIHGLREDSSLWNATNISYSLLSRGVAVFMLDLRGHGLSIYRANGSVVKVGNLKPDDYRLMVLDVQSLIISAENIFEGKPLFIVCSDMGCSIASRILNSPWGKDIRGIVMISPVLENNIGLDVEALRTYSRSLFLIYSELDKASVQAVNVLKEAAVNASIMFYASKIPGHGLNLVLADKTIPNRVASIINIWLSEQHK